VLPAASSLECPQSEIKRRGRPPLDPAAGPSLRVSFYLASGDLRRVTAAASSRGLTRAEWCRRAVLAVTGAAS
jgi:hypothetical protein